MSVPDVGLATRPAPTAPPPAPPAPTPPEPEPGGPDGVAVKLHWIQRLMDNPWILLALGLGIPLLSYTLWGWIELDTIPKATLP